MEDAILTKAAADGTIQDRMPEEGTYIWTDGEDVAFDGGYNGGHRRDGIITGNQCVFVNDGIATFTGTSYWDSGMQGYLYVNDDGSITFSYSTTYVSELYGMEDGSFEPIVLKK